MPTVLKKAWGVERIFVSFSYGRAVELLRSNLTWSWMYLDASQRNKFCFQLLTLLLWKLLPTYERLLTIVQ